MSAGEGGLSSGRAFGGSKATAAIRAVAARKGRAKAGVFIGVGRFIGFVSRSHLQHVCRRSNPARNCEPVPLNGSRCLTYTPKRRSWKPWTAKCRSDFRRSERSREGRAGNDKRIPTAD